MNSVILIGRLTKDPEVRYSTGETPMAICRFTLAVDRPRKESKADFIGCLAFGKTAEAIGNYMKKGRPIAVQGRIQTGSYENKEGRRVYTTEVMVERFDFIGSKNDSPDNSTNEEKQMVIPEGFEAIDESEVPF